MPRLTTLDKIYAKLKSRQFNHQKLTTKTTRKKTYKLNSKANINNKIKQ